MASKQTWGLFIASKKPEVGSSPLNKSGVDPWTLHKPGVGP